MKKNRKRKKWNTSGIIMLIIGIAIASYGCGHVIYNLWSYHQADEEYAYVADTYTDKAADDGSADDETETGSESASGRVRAAAGESADSGLWNDKITPDWDALKKINPDIAAWLYYQDENMGISVSLPVMQAQKDDPDRYLHTTFLGTENRAGCLFITDDSSFRNDLNVIVYGHNMKNGSMFGSLKSLYNDSGSIKDSRFYLYFPDGRVRVYSLYTVVKTTDTSSLYYVPGIKDYEEYCRNLQDTSAWGMEKDDEAEVKAAFQESLDALDDDGLSETFQSEPPLVTLSTCYGMAGTSSRLLITGMCEGIYSF